MTDASSSGRGSEGTWPGLDWQSLVEVGHDLWTAGLVTSHGGNLSLRVPGGGALVTRTGAMLGRLAPDALVAVDAEGRAQRGRGHTIDSAPGAPASIPTAGPSSDTAIHLAAYAAWPEAGAIVHAHPVHAIAIAFHRDAIEPRNLEGRLFLGRVPILDAEWERSAGPVADALAACPVVVVRGHGAYARGVDAWDALRVISALEESAQIIALAG